MHAPVADIASEESDRTDAERSLDALLGEAAAVIASPALRQRYLTAERGRS